MDTIIDSNIIRSDFKLRGFDILVDYLAKTNSKLVLPLIVVEEVKGLYKRNLIEKYEAYKKSVEDLNRSELFFVMPEAPIMDFERDSHLYIDFLFHKLGISDGNIIPYKNEYLPELVSRAIQRKKPLDNKGQQFRDGLLWLTLLDYAENTDEKIIAFISDNVTDFSEKNENKLSIILNEEAESRGVEIRYFRCLSDFAKEHASIIDFITREWVENNVNISSAEKIFGEVLDDSSGSWIDDWILDHVDLERNERTTGYINRLGSTSTEIIEYFVYEKRDSTILLNIEVQFEFEYEIEIERSNYNDMSRLDYYQSPFYGDQPWITNYKYQYPLFRVKFVIPIKDEKVESYEFKEWNWGY